VSQVVPGLVSCLESLVGGAAYTAHSTTKTYHCHPSFPHNKQPLLADETNGSIGVKSWTAVLLHQHTKARCGDINHHNPSLGAAQSRCAASLSAGERVAHRLFTLLLIQHYTHELEAPPLPTSSPLFPPPPSGPLPPSPSLLPLCGTPRRASPPAPPACAVPPRASTASNINRVRLGSASTRLLLLTPAPLLLLLLVAA